MVAVVAAIEFADRQRHAKCGAEAHGRAAGPVDDCAVSKGER
jgi:hypothetical protein